MASSEAGSCLAPITQSHPHIMKEAPPIIERRHHQRHQPIPPHLLKIVLVDDFSSHGEDPEGRRRRHDYCWSRGWHLGVWDMVSISQREK